jgi:hypothetical protein
MRLTTMTVAALLLIMAGFAHADTVPIPVKIAGYTSGASLAPSRTGRPKIIMTTLTTGTTGFTGSVSGVSLYANGADATFTVAMGSSSLSGTTSPTMTLRSGIGISMNPDYIVYSTTVTWISGTLDVIIEGTVP